MLFAGNVVVRRVPVLVCVARVALVRAVVVGFGLRVVVLQAYPDRPARRVVAVAVLALRAVGVGSGRVPEAAPVAGRDPVRVARGHRGLGRARGRPAVGGLVHVSRKVRICRV